ncbi:MAG TPA: c-type cytochrome biogenesis protein CcmI [Methyloceanibacter sp.]|nr:c-type cytochrome biogenesis protein CcmI [Methyloceanibacter sp.]
MLLWIILGCLTALVVFVLLRPLRGAGTREDAREAFNAAVYRDQLGEIDADRSRGLIGESEAEAARLEIARRLLQADSKERATGREQVAGGRARAATVVVATLVPLLTLGLYLLYGSPRLPDQPLAARLEDPSNNQNLEALVARVEARLREHPEEGEGWDVVAPVYMGWQRYQDAADAYGEAIRLLGPTAKRLSGQGQALVLANNGVVSEEARGVLTHAIELDPSLTEPRILIAIAKEQDGKFAAAIADWRALLDKSEGDAPWRQMVEQRIASDEAHLAGKPVPDQPASAEVAPPVAAGPSAGDVAAAQNMSPADRQAMIETMVQRLADRLDQDGSDLGGWLKLVKAYSVLDRKDDAEKALARAKNQFSGNAPALQQLDQLAAELGLKS